MSISRPNIVQQENRLRSLPDEALRTMLLQMGQTGQVGSPEYLLAAGEMQARKNVRQQAQMGQPQQPPVIAELLSGVQMPQSQPQAQPQQMPMAPEDIGVGALPAQNLEALGQPEYAAGGIVAFSGGGASSLGLPIGTSPFVETSYTTPEELRAYRPRFFPGVGSGNRKYALERLGFTRAQIEAMPVEQQEFIVQRAGAIEKPSEIIAEQAKAAPGLQADATAQAQVPPPAPPPAPKDEGLAALAPKPAAYDELMRQSGRYAGQIGPEAETAPSIQDAVAQQKQAMQEAGFDFGLIKDQIAQVRAEKEQSKTDRKDAVNLRLLEAGLGIMAGESPYAFVNIGKGAAPALKGLSDDIKEIKKIDRERDKAMRDLAVADNQIAAGMGLGALKTRESAQDRIARSNEARAAREASIFGTLTSAETQRYVADQGVVAAKERGQEQRDDRLAIEAQRQARELIKASPRGMTMSLEELEREVSTLARSIYNQMKALPTGKMPAGQARGSVVNGVYVPAGQ